MEKSGKKVLCERHTRKENPRPLPELTLPYAQLRQELPADSADLARACQAFQRARVRESPEDLLYLVLL